MNPERWARVKDVFNQALELKPDERGMFVARACAGDPVLQREVESLLQADGGEFMERPAVEMAARLMADERSESLAGAQLNHYRFLSILGTGGMANVYRAHDDRLNREVAIKVLPQAYARDRDRRARFHREAQLLASLNHPNIASIYGIEEDEARFGLILELVEGDTLAERISRGPVTVKEALSVGRQIADGLGAAHAKGIVHRDLKPANIKVTPDGMVKVLDFGIAKMFGAGTPPGLYATPLQSPKPNVILGTLCYMSPEQARGKAVDRRTDIWAWGCVMYELLSGRRAFSGEMTTELLARIAAEDPDWSKLSSDTPAAVRALLRRCLQKDPNQRVRSIVDARIEVDQAYAEIVSGKMSGSWLDHIKRLFRFRK